MQTEHRIFFKNANRMTRIKDRGVDLVVTSPPYPMIEMWDDAFMGLNRKIKTALAPKKSDGLTPFELMHCELDKVWQEVYRVLRPGGFACINIGDATRTVNDHFMLYPNHARILTCLLDLGFSPLPAIIWRKQTNAPNKFMGSGMLPAGAYVTLEHEYILVVRKGNKRDFATPSEKVQRRSSAFFWEERNMWFSDIWMDIKGVRQHLDSKDPLRLRSAAFPFELAYRLINMYSAKDDTVLDPFLGTGTTLLAAMAAARNSVGYEIDDQLQPTIVGQLDRIADIANEYIAQRLQRHIDFIRQRFELKGAFKHQNRHYGFPVVTAQEKELLINNLIAVSKKDQTHFEVNYQETPQPAFCLDDDTLLQNETDSPQPRKKKKKDRPVRPVQMELLN